MPASRDELIEALADLEHDRWSRWERYRTRPEATEGDEAMWERKRETLYSKLTHAEQESDRKEARLTLEVLERLGWTPCVCHEVLPQGPTVCPVHGPVC